MARREDRTPAPEESEVSRANAPALVLVGILAALAFPFLVFSTASSDALRESKLLVQALGASLALLGLALGGGAPRGARFPLPLFPPPSGGAPGGGEPLGGGAGGSFGVSGRGAGGHF